MEAMAILAALTTLTAMEWTGKVEWHTDCKGAINTYAKLSNMRHRQWYAQRDKDVWENIKLIQPMWRKRLNIHHVKAHADEKKSAEELTPEEKCNVEMDRWAKFACLNDNVDPIWQMPDMSSWSIYMHGCRVTGHSKSYIMEQIKIDRAKQRIKQKPDEMGVCPEEIEIRSMIGTAPTQRKHKYEAMFMRNELPTNDRTNEWNITPGAKCEGCGADTETNWHLFHECLHPVAVNIRRIGSEAILAIAREYKASVVLIQTLTDLYGTDANGATNEHTENNMPAS